MKFNVNKLIAITLIGLSLSQPSWADDAMDPTNQLAKLFKHLGLYLGFDLEDAPKETPSIKTRDIKTITATQVNSAGDAILTIPLAGQLKVIPDSQFDVYKDLNINEYLKSWANGIYTNYATPPSQSGQTNSEITVDPSIDQLTYQSDPTSQAVLNVLTTPDFTYCTKGSTTVTSDTIKANCLYQYKVMQNVIGQFKENTDNKLWSPPDIDAVLSASYNQQILPQLNVNSLLEPLIYNTANLNNEGSSTSSQQGLQAKSQAQLAANFIRYVTAQTTPLSLADYNAYSNAITGVMSGDANSTVNLLSYLTNLRNYAAQLSVGFSNFYYVLGKRIQNNKTKTSQAYDEYIMATRRLFSPAKSGTDTPGTSQWITDMEKAAPIALQRESLYLLAEINYQLYLERQQNERLLVTISALQLQSAAAGKSGVTLNNNAPPTATTPKS